jgi:hypothetical protein
VRRFVPFARTMCLLLPHVHVRASLALCVLKGGDGHDEAVGGNGWSGGLDSTVA